MTKTNIPDPQNPREATFLDNLQVVMKRFSSDSDSHDTIDNQPENEKAEQQLQLEVDDNPDDVTEDQSVDAVHNIHEVLDSQYRGVSIFAMAMVVLVAIILWTGVQTIKNVQNYHHEYIALQQLKNDFRKLQIERQRMLIEQQTFSATPQVMNRAVAELNMYYPHLSDRMIINYKGQVIEHQSDDKPKQPLNINPETQH